MTYLELSKQTNSDNTIILVHGTFANNAPWTELNSKLSDHISNELDCSIYRLIWDGKNSNKSRIESAEKLANEIDDIYERDPTCRISIVAHSHGGNIALFCYNYLRNKSALDRIICMGTPYFIFDEEGVKNSIWLMLSFFFLAGFIFLNPKIHLDSNTPLSASQYIFLFSSFVVFLISHRVLSHILGLRLKEKLKKFDYPEKIDAKILNLKYKYDEVSIWLRAFNFFTETPMIIYKYFSTYLFYFIVAFTVSSFTLHYFGEAIDNQGNWKLELFLKISYFISFIMMALLAILVLIKFIFWPILLIVDMLKYTPVGIGWENPLVSLFADVDVSSEFPSITTEVKVEDGELVTHVNYWKWNIRHSQYYIDDDALKKISNFLKDK